MTVDVMLGDTINVLRFMPDNSFDSIVTDPPYGIGFMGKLWDHGVPAAPMWAELLRVLKPGGHLLAFAGTRTQHRMCCNIEDGGFEIRDMIAWVYGSGFPKSHNGEWGGTALKPALEPITVARKPLIGTVEANWRAHGTGALNIDVSRVPTDENLNGGAYAEVRQDSDSPWAASGSLHKTTGEVFVQPTGRWPANLIHDGSDEVLAAFPQAPGQLADASTSASSRKTQNVYGAMKRGSERRSEVRREDDKSAARFFYCAKASRTDRNEGCEHIPAGPLNWSSGTQNPGSFQAEGTDRTSSNNHPTVKPTDLMRYLIRLVTPVGGIVLDPFAGSGSTGKAAALEGFRALLIEREAEYVAIARARIAYALDSN